MTDVSQVAHELTILYLKKSDSAPRPGIMIHSTPESYVQRYKDTYERVLKELKA